MILLNSLMKKIKYLFQIGLSISAFFLVLLVFKSSTSYASKHKSMVKTLPQKSIQHNVTRPIVYSDSIVFDNE